MIFNKSLERIQATPFKIEMATGSVMYNHYNRLSNIVTTLLYTNGKDVPNMLYDHDPNNMDGVYQSGMLDNNQDALRNEFEYRYENKLDTFQEKIDDMLDLLRTYGGHPDKMLERYDKTTKDYLTSKVFPFFKKMEQYYGPGIMTIYRFYVNQILEERTEFKKDFYDDCLRGYIAEQNEKKLCQQITKVILEDLKKNGTMKQAAVVNNFPKEQQKFVRKCLTDLEQKGRIVRGKKDLSKSGIWFLTYVK